MKKILICFILLLVITLAAAWFLFLRPSDGDSTALRDAVGVTATLDDAKGYIAELKDASVDDDFGKALMTKTTVTVKSIAEDGKTAEVEAVVPDMERILRTSLPKDTEGDFDTLFAAYFDAVTEAVRNADGDLLVTKSAECPVISSDSGDTVSVSGMELVSFEALIAEMVEALLGGGEVAK